MIILFLVFSLCTVGVYKKDEDVVCTDENPCFLKHYSKLFVFEMDINQNATETTFTLNLDDTAPESKSKKACMECSDNIITITRFLAKSNFLVMKGSLSNPESFSDYDEPIIIPIAYGHVFAKKSADGKGFGKILIIDADWFDILSVENEELKILQKRNQTYSMACEFELFPAVDMLNAINEIIKTKTKENNLKFWFEQFESKYPPTGYELSKTKGATFGELGTFLKAPITLKNFQKREDGYLRYGGFFSKGFKILKFEGEINISEGKISTFSHTQKDVSGTNFEVPNSILFGLLVLVIAVVGFIIYAKFK